jgi:hypothetical protein
METATCSTLSDRRRFVGTTGGLEPRQLLATSRQSAEAQLREAREALKAARRRVVELEEAVQGWHELDLLFARSSSLRAGRN